MADYVLITGASGGIGFELAKIAASHHMNLILLARNAEKLLQLRAELEERYPVKVLAVGCDLAKADTVEKVAALLQGRNIVPDILINNAGFGMYGPFDQGNMEVETDMLQLNIVSLTGLTKVIYQQMRSKGRGRIMNVSSLAGFIPGPWMAVYHATKAYVLSFSEALAVEAKGTGVTVTALCPGPTKTNFENRASDGNGIKFFQKSGKIPTARQVAEFGWESMMKGKTVAIHGVNNRWLIFICRFVPRKIVASIAGKMQA